MTEYATGQIWALPAIDSVPPILVAIHSLETQDPIGTILGVSVTPHPEAKKLGWPTVSHLPIHAAHIDLELGRLVSEDAEPREDFWEGYNIWAAKLRTGDAGVFALSAAKTYGLTQAILKDKNDD